MRGSVTPTPLGVPVALDAVVVWVCGLPLSTSVAAAKLCVVTACRALEARAVAGVHGDPARSTNCHLYHLFGVER